MLSCVMNTRCRQLVLGRMLSERIIFSCLVIFSMVMASESQDAISEHRPFQAGKLLD